MTPEEKLNVERAKERQRYQRRRAYYQQYHLANREHRNGIRRAHHQANRADSTAYARQWRSEHVAPKRQRTTQPTEPVKPELLRSRFMAWRNAKTK